MCIVCGNKVPTHTKVPETEKKKGCSYTRHAAIITVHEAVYHMQSPRDDTWIMFKITQINAADTNLPRGVWIVFEKDQHEF